MQLKFVLSFIFGVVQLEIPGIVLSDSSDTWMLYIGKKTQLVHLQNREKLWVLSFLDFSNIFIFGANTSIVMDVCKSSKHPVQ